MFIQFLGSLSDAGQPALWWYSRLRTSNEIQGDYPFKIRQQTVSGSKPTIYRSTSKRRPIDFCASIQLPTLKAKMQIQVYFPFIFLFFEP
jgi:hypothetical protein